MILSVFIKPINMTLLLRSSFVAFVCCLFLTPAGNLVGQQPIPVSVVKKDHGWQLLRQEKPYYINGAGGPASLQLLSDCGGNSSRLWNVGKDTKARLDEAHKNGVSVAVGIWLEHERKGFDYNDPKQLEQQKSFVRASVEKYKNHPAVLVWGIGNEMEGYEKGDDPAIWNHVEELCQMIKTIDPHHPTMSVIAEVGGNRVAAIHKHCPSLDIIGINSYGGASTLPQRYRKAGGKKPYVVTEFGPAGPWEVGRNNLNTVDDLPTNKRGDIYRASYSAAKQDSEFCLGSYAFLWGNKLEATSIWFGMLLEDDECRTAAVDTMSELWTGKPPKNRCPEIKALTLGKSNEVPGSTELVFDLAVSDPEGDPLSVQWSVRPEVKTYITYGDPQPPLPRLDSLILESSVKGAKIRTPEKPGLYRIYCFVRDDHSGGAASSVSFKVVGTGKNDAQSTSSK